MTTQVPRVTHGCGIYMCVPMRDMCGTHVHGTHVDGTPVDGTPLHDTLGRHMFMPNMSVSIQVPIFVCLYVYTYVCTYMYVDMCVYIRHTRLPHMFMLNIQT